MNNTATAVRLQRYLLDAVLALDPKATAQAESDLGDLDAWLDTIPTLSIVGERFRPKGAGQAVSRGPVARGRVETYATGPAFREREANETWAEYGAAHKAWKRARQG